MLSAKDISERLANQVEAVCKELLPQGKMIAGNWCVGSLGGEQGESLRVQITGGKAGLWGDFASNENGDILDLWAKVRGISLGAAIKEAKAFLRISDPIPANPPKKYAKPKFGAVTKLKENPDTDVEKYLTGERKLSKETILKYRVGQVDHPAIGRSMVFPSRNAENTEWIAAKYIALKRDEKGKKIILNEAGQAPCLFGWQAVEKGVRKAIITEGQIDAMTWNQWTEGNFAVLSVPNGTGDAENWIDYEWDNLLQFDDIYLSFDMDEPGIKFAQAVARRLGIHRCPIIKLPHNDANECLQKGCNGFAAGEWLKAAKPIQPQEIKAPIEFRERIRALERRDETTGKKEGFTMSCLGDRVRFLPGLVTLWTGYSFHGKSTLLNQLCIEAALAGEGVAIGSFEMAGELTCLKAAKCLTLKQELTDEEMDSALNWMGGKIWIYDVTGIIGQERLFALMTYSVMRHGVKQIVVDSLMKTDIANDDYDAQRKLLNRLCDFAKTYGVHIHVVAHPKKADGDAAAPDIMDVHGGQAVGGQADITISVWKNTKKSDRREEEKLPASEEMKSPDTIAYVRKNRVDGHRYSMPLWFHRGCYRFTASISADGDEPYFPIFLTI